MIPTRDLFVQYRAISGVKYIVKNYDVFQLDEVGEIIWEAIDGETSVEQIAEQVAAKYQVEKEIVLQDTQAFIQDMLAKELIEVVE